jgi:hypothetical protein
MEVAAITPKYVNSGVAKTAAGRLENVGLGSHEFRLRDDVDNAVDLRYVENDTVAEQLVGQWVIAQGTGILHASGRMVALENARVFHADDPAADFIGKRVITRAEILASAPGPDLDGGIDLTDDEFQAFVEALRS